MKNVEKSLLTIKEVESVAYIHSYEENKKLNISRSDFIKISHDTQIILSHGDYPREQRLKQCFLL